MHYEPGLDTTGRGGKRGADLCSRILKASPWAVRVEAGRDPRSIDVGPDGVIWFGTTLGVFCTVPEDG